MDTRRVAAVALSRLGVGAAPAADALRAALGEMEAELAVLTKAEAAAKAAAELAGADLASQKKAGAAAAKAAKGLRAVLGLVRRVIALLDGKAPPTRRPAETECGPVWRTVTAVTVRYCLSVAFHRLSWISRCLSLPWHRLFLTSRCLSVTVHRLSVSYRCLSLPWHRLSVTSRCLSLPWHRLSLTFRFVTTASRFRASRWPS